MMRLKFFAKKTEEINMMLSLLNAVTATESATVRVELVKLNKLISR